MRKPRPDAKLLTLSDAQQTLLCDWLLSGMPYHKVRPLVEAQFNIKTSNAALSNFWDSVCSVELSARRARAVKASDEVAKDIARRPGQFDKATIDLLQQRAFELASNPGVNPEEVKEIFALVLKSRDQDIREKDIDIKLRRLQLVENQMQKAADALRKPDLDPGKLADEIDRILGRKS
jgi:hypothetical protein